MLSELHEDCDVTQMSQSYLYTSTLWLLNHHIHDLLRGIVTPPNMCSLPHIKHID